MLLGHSQGTRMLRQLLRKTIEPDAAARNRIVSAILLGGNVTVRRGQLGGGDFQHTPACTRPEQTRCVIAFSTFNETPPPNSRYGRVPDEDTSGFGFPVGPEYEVLCTNPSSLGDNRRGVLETLLRGEPFPGVIGALMTVMYGGPQPSAPTPYLRPQDHYTGRCESRDGANVLMLEPVGSARRLNPSPDPTWGLHLLDANIALGDLVRVVARQSAAYLSPAAPRAVALALRATRTRRCGVRVRLKGADLPLVRRVDFRAAGRQVRDARPPFSARFGRRTIRLRATALLFDGRRRTIVSRLGACAR